MRIFRHIPTITALVCLAASMAQSAVRVKDVARVQESGRTQLIGYGLVVGLSGTGDGRTTEFTNQSLANMLDRMGIRVDEDRMRTRNVAAVIVTSEVPSRARMGHESDVTVSALGDARSLRGGTLLMTSLSTPTGRAVASAQGPIAVGGYDVDTGDTGSLRKNVATVGRIPGGAHIQAIPDPTAPAPETIHVDLHSPDYTSASRLAAAINAAFGSDLAIAQDAGRVDIGLDSGFPTVDLIAQVEAVTFEDDRPARVVVDERTGTVVIGAHVQLAPAAVSHGNLSIEIRKSTLVSQPGAFSSGETIVVDQTNASVSESEQKVVGVESATTVQDIVSVLNDLGTAPRDLIQILHALHRAGSLRGELVVL